MKKPIMAFVALSMILAAGPASSQTGKDPATQVREAETASQTGKDPATQVREAETAFAKSLASRDHGAFATYVSDEALFFNRDAVLRGRTAVVAGWKPLFEGPDAPFSWKPEQVEVLDSGTLALSSGPIHDPEGRQIGTFTSIWRLEADGRWRVVFDKGCPPCEK